MVSSRTVLVPLDIIICAVIGWLLVGYIRFAVSAPPSFDGAMNLNTAFSFMRGKGYGFVYDVYFPFPAQTDGPFTLPAGLLMYVGGVNPLTTQGVNFAYLMGTSIAVAVLLQNILAIKSRRRNHVEFAPQNLALHDPVPTVTPSSPRSISLAIAGTLIFLLTPGLFPFGMNGYGEIPMLFWLLMSLITLAPILETDSPRKVHLFVGGVALGLCYLTKTISLMLVVPTFATFTTLLLLRHGRRTGDVLLFVVGITLPIVGWELFRLMEIGNLTGYMEWWQLQTREVLQQSGARESLAGGISFLPKFTKHLGILANQVGTPLPLLAILLLIPWVVTIALVVRKARERDFQTLFCLIACGASSFGYFLWWLLITPTGMAWLRRILDGLVLQQILVIVAFSALVGVLRDAMSGMPARLLAAVLAGSLIISEICIGSHALAHQPNTTKADLDTLDLANKIRRLPPDSKLFGFGWWQAPVLALFSGRQIMNFYRWDPADIDALEHKYFVEDMYAMSLAPPNEIQEILSTTSFRIVAGGAGGTIYELVKVFPYAPFSDEDRHSTEIAAGFDLVTGPYVCSRGFYSPEGKVAWVRPDSALLLRRTTQVRFSLSIYVPPRLIESAGQGRPLSLHLTSPDCLDSSIPVLQSGTQTITVPLECSPTAQPELMEVSLHLNGNVPFTRQIDSDPRRLAFIVISARLENP